MNTCAAFSLALLLCGCANTYTVEFRFPPVVSCAGLDCKAMVER